MSIQRMYAQLDEVIGAAFASIDDIISLHEEPERPGVVGELAVFHIVQQFAAMVKDKRDLVREQWRLPAQQHNLDMRLVAALRKQGFPMSANQPGKDGDDS